MSTNLLIAFGALTFLCAIAAIDEMLDHKPILGEEWDFLTPNNRRRH